jgi:putative oxidoreductase
MMIDSQRLATVWGPRALAALRVIGALLFIEHGLVKLFGFPTGAAPGPQPLASLLGVGAVMETVGGALVAIGLFARPVAFLLSGEMAVAYFLVHAPRSFFPAVNGGDGAILFCFIFLYIAMVGPGAWSIDRLRGNG